MDIEVLDCIKDAALIEQYKREVVEEEYEQQHPWDSCQEGDILCKNWQSYCRMDENKTKCL